MAGREDRLLSKIPYVIRSLDDAWDKAGAAGAHRMAETARALCPVQTGKLKESIEVVKERAPGGHEFHVQTKVFYANWVEFGTRHASAQPFLMPAFELHRKDFENGFGLAIKEVVYSNAGYSRGMVPLR